MTQEPDATRNNVVVIMNDTLRRDHVAAYGDPVPWVRPGREDLPFIETPELDKLASEAAMFDRFYVSSYPTVPCRTDLFTGRCGFPTRGWEPLKPDDVILSEILGRNGWVTQLVFDTPMLAQGSYNFDRGFSGWDFVRGQHGDRWITEPMNLSLPAPARKLRTVDGTIQYLKNTAFRRNEEDWMCARTVTSAMRWLEANRMCNGFCLWVDMWDPHDPFDAPEYDVRRYVNEESFGAGVIFPEYGRSDYLTDEEINFVRGSYAGLVTVMDRWVGKLIDKIGKLGLSDRTMIVYLTDHGHLFGDHGLEGKPTAQLGNLYEVTVHCPLLIRHPGGFGANTRPGGLAQHVDILPTILEFLGVEVPSSVQGKSLLPALGDPGWQPREFVVSGRHSPYPGVGRTVKEAASFDGWAGPNSSLEPLTVTDGEWSFICPPAGEGAPELYNLSDDPQQLVEVSAASSPRLAKMREALLEFLIDSDAPGERVDMYRADRRDTGSKRSYPYLDDSDQLYVIMDGHGRRFAYETEAEARQRLSCDMPEQEPEAMEFGFLRASYPDALVGLGQYYWVADLASRPLRERSRD